jgi:hypothetical protein
MVHHRGHVPHVGVQDRGIGVVAQHLPCVVVGNGLPIDVHRVRVADTGEFGYLMGVSRGRDA